MFRKTICLLWVIWGSTVSAQTPQDSLILAEINTQIWRPFIAAYNSFDGKAYNKIHTDDVLRGSPWGLRTGQEYHQQNLERFDQQKATGIERQIAFTFEHRIHQPDVAYEVGFYRVIAFESEKSTVSFGQFHVVLRKKDGVWQIAQDWDADTINGEKITGANFLKYAPAGIYE